MQALTLLSSTALILWALRMVRTGFNRAFGSNLRNWVAAGTRNRCRAFVAGLFATLLVQSSTATAVVTASFASAGLVSTAMAQGIMLGANVGTSLIACIFVLRIKGLSAMLTVTGVALFMFNKRAPMRGISRALIGVGLMLLASEQLNLAISPLTNSPLFPTVANTLNEAPLLVLILGIATAALASSSLVAVLIASSMAGMGLSPILTIWFVLGANIGGAIMPVLVTLRADDAGLRITAGNLFVRATGALIATVLTYYGRGSVGVAEYALELLSRGPGLAILTHLVFNSLLGLLFLPFVNAIAQTSERLLPDKPNLDKQSRYLDDRSLNIPQVALVGAARESLRIVDLIQRMLRQSLEAERSNDTFLCAQTSALDDQVDALHARVKAFLIRLEREALNAEEKARSREIMSFVINLEHVGDIIDRSLLKAIQKKAKRKLAFSEDGQDEIADLFSRTTENLQIAQGVLLSRDLNLARQLIQAKAHIREAEKLSAENHLERLTADRFESVQTSSIHLDMLRDLKRINTHIAAIASSILEEVGEMRATRLIPGTAT